MKHLRLLSSVALVSLLAACGGGGGGMTPGPTVSSAGSGDNNSGSTSTNSPPPQAGPANTVAGYTVVDGSNASSVLDQSAIPAASSEATVTVNTNAQTPTVTIVTPKYSKNDTVTPTDAAHFFQNAANWSTITSSNDPNGYATIASNGKATDGLQYSDYGLWQSNVTANGVGSTLRGAYATGEQTLAANMPKTGTASYQGHAQGLVTIPGSDGNTPYGFIGALNANADFGKQTIDIGISSLQPTSLHTGVTPPDLTGSTIGVTGGTITGSAYSGGTPSGNVAGIPVTSVTSAGQFNGAQANEISGVVSFSGASGSGMNGITSYGAAKH